MLRTQGISILLNLFFGSLINAARGIAVQITNVVSSFSQNFITALRPQVTKLYADERYHEMIGLVFWSAKLSYFFMYIFTIPLLFEMSYIIKIWLINPPPYTIFFICLGFLDILFESVSYPLMYVAQATGKIKVYQSVISGIILLNVPFAYLSLKIGFPPYSVMFIGIFLTVITFFVRIFMIKRLLILFSIKTFIKRVLLPIFYVSALSLVLPSIIVNILDESVFRLCISFMSIIITVFCIYFIGLSKTEQLRVQKYVVSALERFFK
jgi:hypothetical protein